MADANVITIEEDAEGDSYLSIRDAAVEFGVKPSAIRKLVSAGRVAMRYHAWGVRVRRSDVAHLAQIIANPPRHEPAPARTRIRVPQAPQHRTNYSEPNDRLDQSVLAIVSEIGPLTLARLHEAIRLEYDVTFPSLVYATRRLVAAQRLQRRKGERGDIYELATENKVRRVT